MKGKKVMYLLVAIIMLMGKQPLAVQVVQTEKPVCCVGVYTYIIGEDYENNNMIRMRGIIRCPSMEMVCPEDFGLNIHVLLMNSSKKVYTVRIRVEKRCVGEIYLVYKKNTIIKFAILNGFKNEYNRLKISGMIRMEKEKIFGVVVLEDYTMGYFFQMLSLNKLMIGIFLFVTIMITLCFYDENLRDSQFMYKVHGDMDFEDNMEWCNREFLLNLVNIIEEKWSVVRYALCKEEYECIRKLLVLTDGFYLTLGRKWIQNNLNIIIYSVDKVENKKICDYSQSVTDKINL